MPLANTVTRYGGMAEWPIPGLTDGIANISAAIVGLPAGVIVTIVVSKMTKEPSQEMQDMIDEVRRPSGETIMQEKTV